VVVCGVAVSSDGSITFMKAVITSRAKTTVTAATNPR
jgi:hypothetical protein